MRLQFADRRIGLAGVEVFRMQVNFFIAPGDQGDVTEQGDGSAEHGPRMIEEKVGQVGPATAEADADRRTGADEDGGFPYRGQALGGDDLDQAPLGIYLGDGIEAKVEQLEEVFPRGVGGGRAEAAIHAALDAVAAPAALQHESADVAIGDDADQAVRAIEHEGDLGKAAFEAVDGLVNGLIAPQAHVPKGGVEAGHEG